MKKSLTDAVALLIAAVGVSVAGSADKDAIMAKEKAAWQSYKNKDADGFKKVVDKDFKGVYAEGVQTVSDELASMKKWDMKSATISDFTMFSDEKDVAVTTYTVKLEDSLDGQDMSGTYNCGSVWKLEGSDWLAIFHTNIKAEAAK